MDILRRTIVEQAATMLVEHVTSNRQVYRLAKNNNGHTYHEYIQNRDHCSANYRRNVERTDKCQSWLLNYVHTDDNIVDK
jgi:hypothetical protein